MEFGLDIASSVLPHPGGPTKSSLLNSIRLIPSVGLVGSDICFGLKVASALSFDTGIGVVTLGIASLQLLQFRMFVGAVFEFARCGTLLTDGEKFTFLSSNTIDAVMCVPF